jgi:hypothetical protein
MRQNLFLHLGLQIVDLVQQVLLGCIRITALLGLFAAT